MKNLDPIHPDISGGVNYEDTLTLCRDLSAIDGVDGIMLSTPIFYPYFTYSGLLEFLCDAGII